MLKSTQLLEVNGMAVSTFEQVKNLVSQLTVREREKLLEYLKPHIETHQNGDAEKSKNLTLEEVWRMSDELTAKETSKSETLTQEFLRTRR
jgi:hypothetical protein